MEVTAERFEFFDFLTEAPDIIPDTGVTCERKVWPVACQMVPPSMSALFASRFQNRHGITAGDPVTVPAESPLPTARWSVMETCSAPDPRRGCAGSPTQARGRARAQDPPRLHSASESAMEAYGCPYASMALGICSVGAGCVGGRLWPVSYTHGFPPRTSRFCRPEAFGSMRKAGTDQEEALRFLRKIRQYKK